MKVLKKRPGGEWHLAEIENTLEALQVEVGGYIETITLCSDLCLIVNEEGRINAMPFNMNLAGVHLFGTILVVGVSGDEFTDVPDGGLELFTRRVRT